VAQKRVPLDSQSGSDAKPGFLRRHRWLLIGGSAVLVLAVAAGTWFLFLGGPDTGQAEEGREAPEAQRVIEFNRDMPFQILIPAYLPKEFDRANAKIQVNAAGPMGEAMAELTYQTKKGETVSFREWVPPNPKLETLGNSRPIQTKWGPGWLLTHINMYAIWTDIGPTRVATFTGDIEKLPKEQLLAIAESLGPPSNQQVFYFKPDQQVKDVAPPPPYQPPVNAQGVQEFTLVVTPGGYDPIRIALKKGVPVRMTFKQLGDVGCGQDLVFPADPVNPSSLHLDGEGDSEVLEFTPPTAGEYSFYCPHQMYRGILFVRE
jgi:hypothetical protein